MISILVIDDEKGCPVGFHSCGHSKNESLCEIVSCSELSALNTMSDLGLGDEVMYAISDGVFRLQLTENASSTSKALLQMLINTINLIVTAHKDEFEIKNM